ncbi:MAG: hypothetical protein WC641_07555 [Patescibacteria group bacterium]
MEIRKLVILFVCVLCCGCSDEVDAIEATAAPAPCVPGQGNFCLCLDGEYGFQTCSKDGTTYSDCVCPLPDAGENESAVPDAAAPCPSSVPAQDCPQGWFECALGPLAQIAPSSLIKSTGPAVYWYGADRRRYVFPNEKTYRTWFPLGEACPAIHPVSPEDLASVNNGGSVCYRPGTRLVKITTDPKTYAVSHGCVLRWVESEALSAEMFGPDWATLIDDVSDAFYGNYSFGKPIASAADYDRAAELASSPTPDEDLGLKP